VNHPTPAIVTQAAARRFPRWALLLLCLTYVVAGFVGRDAWRSADQTALGYMGALAQGTTDWLLPNLLGWQPTEASLLPYWLGAWAIQLTPVGWAADMVARIPFALLVGISMLGGWYGTYYLARDANAQPVAFAFGGEAKPTDYARAMADGGLLAFIACLGLAQLSHETTPAVAQLAFAALLFYGFAALPHRTYGPHLAIALGTVGLALSGAPGLGLLWCLGGTALGAWSKVTPDDLGKAMWRRYASSLALLGYALVAGGLAWWLGLWRWRIALPPLTWGTLDGFVQLLVWFTWPAWPLALWTLWRWRHQWLNRSPQRHLAWPLGFAVVTVIASFLGGDSDRTLLLALPALAALAAFALPTLKRQVSALIDWFTLLFFSGCGFTIWVVWIAMQTGVPSQPAANVARLAPGFVASFSMVSLTVAILATAAWGWLVHWRVGRHRAAIWKSLVLPAGGAALCWLLLMTLWMPLLNYAQSYRSLVAQLTTWVPEQACVDAATLEPVHLAAIQWYSPIKLHATGLDDECQWMLTEPRVDLQLTPSVDTRRWEPIALLRHPVDRSEALWLLRRR
jgi:4-amino-4-deoxy-L-arabinose transferase-like glycosyltransferase